MARSELPGYLYEKSGDSYVDVCLAGSHRPPEQRPFRLRMISNSPELPRLQQQMRMIASDRMTETNTAKSVGLGLVAYLMKAQEIKG